MLPNRYASEHFNIPLASGVFKYLQKSFAESTLLSTAVLKVPACDQMLPGASRLSSEFWRLDPSKFAGFRRVICLRTRSPVFGRINVPFLSFYSLVISFLRLDDEG
jgi:hypothetical protein